MLILGISSLFRNHLGISYKAWRIFHGLLSTAFVVIASWHAIELGRHTNTNMSVLIIVLAGIGIFTLMKSYLINRRNKR
jgi:predicted ferric reductase